MESGRPPAVPQSNLPQQDSSVHSYTLDVSAAFYHNGG